MKRAFTLVVSICFSTALAFPAAAQSTFSMEGRAVKAAGSLNPPNPVELCNAAKRDAEQKAAQAGSIGLVSWDRLSNDSDCRLETQQAGSAGYYFIFTARGVFRK
jgi:hypothetical protein